MIRAAALSGIGQAAPPPVLVEFLRFLRYGLPPLAGGQRDQPVGWFARGETLYQAREDWREWTGSDKTAAWRKAHAAQWERIARLRAVIEEGEA